MGFGADVAKIAKQINATVDEVQRAVTLEMFNSVIDNTRVDTGRARGNWQTTVDVPAQTSLVTTDPDGGQTKEKAAAAMKPKSLMIITNNLVYIGNLEELDGMIGKTVARIDRIIRSKAKGK